MDVIVVGRHHEAEFQPMMASLRRQARIIPLENLEQTLALLRLEAIAAPTVLLLRSLPSEHTLGEVQQLQQAFPLARVVAVRGPWAEDASRQGLAWPGVPEFQPDQLLWLGADNKELASTASGEEVFLAGLSPQWTGGTGLVVISAVNPESARWLNDACRCFGYQTVVVQRCSGGLLPPDFQHCQAVAGLWQGQHLQGLFKNQFCSFLRSLPEVPVIALLDFPREEDCQVAKKFGPGRVLAQPVPLGVLALSLSESIASPASAPPATSPPDSSPPDSSPPDSKELPTAPAHFKKMVA